MDLRELRSELSVARSNHSKSVAFASKFVKGVLILGGALVAGVAQFCTWPTGGSPDAAQVAGMLATAVVAVGGLYVTFTEADAATAVATAEKAMDVAQQMEAAFDDVDEFFDDSARLAETYQLCLTMRGAIEQSALGFTGGIKGLVGNLFDLASRPLTVAIGFNQSDRWTLGVYMAMPAAEAGKVQLKTVAQKRAIECGLDDARIWPEGVGIAGICYTNSREIVLPDLRAEGMRAVFGPRNLTRQYDTERYVSMVAVPVKVSGREKPWGVIVATSDQAGHFSADTQPGFKNDEPVRALAAFIALAVAMMDAQDRARSTSSPAVTDGSSGA